MNWILMYWFPKCFFPDYDPSKWNIFDVNRIKTSWISRSCCKWIWIISGKIRSDQRWIQYHLHQKKMKENLKFKKDNFCTLNSSRHPVQKNIPTKNSVQDIKYRELGKKDMRSQYEDIAINFTYQHKKALLEKH